jgi:hypothetical protein
MKLKNLLKICGAKGSLMKAPFLFYKNTLLPTVSIIIIIKPSIFRIIIVEDINIIKCKNYMKTHKVFDKTLKHNAWRCYNMDKKVVPFKKGDNDDGGNNNMGIAIATSRNIIAAKTCSREKEDEVILRLRESGKKLSSILGINQDHIRKAITETRQEWK